MNRLNNLALNKRCGENTLVSRSEATSQYVKTLSQLKYFYRVMLWKTLFTCYYQFIHISVQN